MRNKGLETVRILLILITLLFVGFISGGADNKKSNYAITVSMNKKVYIVDLNTFKVIKESEPFMEIGRPTAIDYDKTKGRLYVASERGEWQKIYYPLTVFEIKANSIKLLDKFKLEEKEPVGEFETVWAIYGMKLSPHTNKLYLMYANPKYGGGSEAIFDLSSKTIVGKLNFHIREGKTILSPDGKKACTIIPPGSRMIKKDGKEKIKKWKGYVETYDIEKNEKIENIEAKDLIKSGRGFNPLWTKIDTPLVQIPFESDGTGWRRIKVYSRMSGREISEIDLEEICGGLTPTRDYVLFLPDSKHKVILPMVGESGAYLVIIDLERKKVDAKIEIDATPTNVILFDALL